MLVLTRRVGESIIIGNGIKLTVVHVGPGRVKIGIDAPPSIRIDREEIHARVMQERAEEKNADVLEAVSAEVATHADQATMVTGPDTGLLNHAVATHSSEDMSDAGQPRLSTFRRKPR
ncbi:MAG TPA: carbon storage regulator [Gemmata sp.]|nr:carbon storage regulator [Gemmata sp.]